MLSRPTLLSVTCLYLLIEFNMDELEGDCIEVKNLMVEVKVGVTDAELSNFQKVSICLKLLPCHSLSQLGDDITRTIDYHAVCERVTEAAKASERRLIETLAEDLADLLLAEFNLRRVAVEVRKFILPDTDYVAVRLIKGA